MITVWRCRLPRRVHYANTADRYHPEAFTLAQGVCLRRYPRTPGKWHTDSQIAGPAESVTCGIHVDVTGANQIDAVEKVDHRGPATHLPDMGQNEIAHHSNIYLWVG